MMPFGIADVEMTERIYTRDSDGKLTALEEERFTDEDTLQRLIAEHPELLDGEQIRPGDPRRWILVTREQGVPDTVGSTARWSLDHLLIDQDGVPTLVEVKRGANPEVRRTVVGQMLDYAAHAPLTWTIDELRRTFEGSVDEPDEELRKLLLTDGELDSDAFWEGVSTNLAAKRLRLLFVADAIPDELAHVVEFLNEQMPNIEVLAVEIKQFRSFSMQTLVPRVIGRTAGVSGSAVSRSSSSRRKLDRDILLDELSDDDVRAAALRLLDVAEECGARLSWGSASVTIRAICDSWTKPVTVAWIYVPSESTSWAGQSEFTFGATLWGPGMPDDVRDFFLDWSSQFAMDSFSHDVSREQLPCWTVRYRDVVAHARRCARTSSWIGLVSSLWTVSATTCPESSCPAGR